MGEMRRMRGFLKKMKIVTAGRVTKMTIKSFSCEAVRIWHLWQPTNRPTLTHTQLHMLQISRNTNKERIPLLIYNGDAKDWYVARSLLYCINHLRRHSMVHIKTRQLTKPYIYYCQVIALKTVEDKLPSSYWYACHQPF